MSARDLNLSSADWDRLDSLVGRFEQAWRAGPRPALTDFLPVEPTLRRVLLVELIHADLEFRRRAGEDAGADSYLQQYPELADDRPAVLGLLRREFELRRESDPVLTPSAFAARYPAYGEDLAACLDGVADSPNPGSETVSLPSTLIRRDRPASPAFPDGEGFQRCGYEVLGVLGRGGMGVVYQARQVRLKRLVALKMVLAGGHADDQELGRFRTEAEAVARLKHPHIVQIYDVGDLEGRPYLALEYVDGGNLARKLAGTPLPPAEAARLAEMLARAVHAAHERGVVHRDLKPANVLLTADGIPKIADFGLAKQLDDDSARTRSGAIMGTPSYMAPEQASGQVQAVGPATDVYSLGAILYEMLTGRPPFRGATVLDTLEQVRSQEPSPIRAQRPGVPRDIETICHKCLDKDIRKRYASAHELAEDLRRQQAGEPIQARPVGPGERLLKWARRRPAIATLLATLAVVTAVSFAVVTYQLGQTRAALELAEKNADNYRRETIKANLAVAGKTAALKLRDRHLYAAQANLIEQYWEKHQFGPVTHLLKEQTPELRGWEWHYYQRLVRGRLRAPSLRPRGYLGIAMQNAENQAGVLITSIMSESPASKAGLQVGDIITKIGDRSVGQTPEMSAIVSELSPGNPVTFHLLRNGRQLTIPVTIAASPFNYSVYSLAFSPDGERLATAGSAVRVFATGTGQELFRITKHKAMVTGVAYSPDGKYLASIGHDGTVGLWLAKDGSPVREFVHPAVVHHQYIRRVAFSPDSRWLASGGGGNVSEIKVWDVDTGREVHTLNVKGSHVTGLAFSPDGRQIGYSTRFYHGPRVWDLATNKQESTHSHVATAVAFSPNGRLLACSGWSNDCHVWDLQERRLLHSYKLLGAHDDVTFSPDGRLFAAAGHDSNVKVWDTASGALVGTLPHNFYLECVAFSPDGRLIAAGGFGGVQLWDLAALQGAAGIQTAPYSVSQVAFSPNGRQLALADGAVVKVCDPVTRQVIHAFKGHGSKVSGLAFRSDGRMLASISVEQDKRGEIKLWDLTDGKELLTISNVPGKVRTLIPQVWGLSFSPDGGWLAAGGPNDSVVIWDAASGQVVRTLQGHQGAVKGVAFSPDGRVLASAGEDGMVHVWDTASGQVSRSLKIGNYALAALGFNPAGDLLAIGGTDSSGAVVKIWDWRGDAPARSFVGHSNFTTAVSFSPNGQRLATTAGGWGNRGEVKVWDLESGQEVATFYDHENTTSGVAFSPDGHWLASAGVEGIKLRDARPLTPAVRLEREAVELLDFLIDKPLPKAEVTRRVLHDPTISEEVRAEAMKLLERYQEADDRRRYVSASRYLTQQQYLDARWYREALVQAEHAIHLAPKDAAAHTALGLAQYRLGQYPEAIQTLTLADRLARGVPANLAFLAMSHYRLDERARVQAQLSQAFGLSFLVPEMSTAHLKEAQAALQRLREACRQPRWANDPSTADILHEAETLILQLAAPSATAPEPVR